MMIAADSIGRTLQSGFSLAPLGRLTYERDNRSTTGSEDLLTLSKDDGLIPFRRQVGDQYSAPTLIGYKKCRPGDIIMNRMQAWNGVFALSKYEGLVSPDYVVLEPSQSVDARFLVYWLRSDHSAGLCEVYSRGVGTGFLRLQRNEMNAMPVPYIPVPHQRLIADLLDRETERIDALVDTKRKLIGIVVEKRAALITQAVTKGLDPSVPMKDSGIRWIGEIPAHWGISSINHVVDSISDGPFGSSLASTHYSASGTRVVRLGNLGQGEFLAEDAAYIPDHYAEVLAAHRLRPGDLLMAGLGDERRSLGRTVVVPPEVLPAIHKADCFRLRPGRLMLGAFLASYMSSNAGSASAVALAQGTTRQRINTTIARSLPVPVPPMREQQAIDTFLNDKRSPFERTTKNLAIQLTLLAQYRQALITAAVTGQLDAETLKGRKPADEAMKMEVPS